MFLNVRSCRWVVVRECGYSIGMAGGGLKLEHFAAMRWADPDGGEGLARGPADTLGTLLHEAARALAHVREIKDTSPEGRWHDARFKALAEELGIEVTKDSRIGWSPTTSPAITNDAERARTDPRSPYEWVLSSYWPAWWRGRSRSATISRPAGSLGPSSASRRRPRSVPLPSCRHGESSR
jgi:hypothetical protein